MTAPREMTPSVDPYLLRGLIWCGPCELPMSPHREAAGEKRRTYKCSMGCRSVDVLAEAVESVTWTAAERRAAVSAIAAPYRQSVLAQLLVKVVVEANGVDVYFVWRT